MKTSDEENPWLLPCIVELLERTKKSTCVQWLQLVGHVWWLTNVIL